MTNEITFGDLKEAERQFEHEWKTANGSRLNESSKQLCRTMFLLGWLAREECLKGAKL